MTLLRVVLERVYQHVEVDELRRGLIDSRSDIQQTVVVQTVAI